MDAATRDFIATSTLMFVASRNAAGAMDVSPRGGQPAVVRLTDDGRLLLPDYPGNRRLDTIGNVLRAPEVALLLLNRGTNRYLHVNATASVSGDPDLLRAFPADENPPLSVMVFTPGMTEFVDTAAFGAADFWVGSAGRKPPLDLGAIYSGDRVWQADRARAPVMRDRDGEAALTDTGWRDHYGAPSPAVQTKVYEAAGPAFMDFIDDARFVVLARMDAAGAIRLDLVGGQPLRRDPQANDDSFLLTLPHGHASATPLPDAGECAILAAEPGRNENIRLNGRYRTGTDDPAGLPRIVLGTEEIYFHCSAALARSRIWTESRPVWWAGRRRFICIDRRQESPDVMSFVLQPDDDAPLGDILPGQYVTVTLADDPRRPQPGRSYSVSDLPDQRALRITVRRIGAGGVSDLLHDRLQIGAAALLGTPSGSFTLTSPPGRTVVLVSAGVGITPLMPMLQAIAAEAAPPRDVWFIHAARDAAHHLFPDSARRIADASAGRIRLITAYSRATPDAACDHHGRIDADLIAGLTDVTQADTYICGPTDFMQDLRDGLIARGATPESVRYEEFAPRRTGLVLPGTGQTAVPARVTFRKSGKVATWTPADGSLLDLALAQGIDPAFSCRNGECLTCVQTLTAGAVDYPTADVPFLAYGQVLLCTAIPAGDVEIDC